jgi:hypothetical protein
LRLIKSYLKFRFSFFDMGTIYGRVSGVSPAAKRLNVRSVDGPIYSISGIPNFDTYRFGQRVQLNVENVEMIKSGWFSCEFTSIFLQ